MDGLNTLAAGYCLLILFSLIFIFLNNQIIFPNYDLLLITVVSLLVVFLFNIFGKIYLGDNGAYLVAFIISILLIEISKMNHIVSPFYVANLLWYPAFENFFSIIRKKINKINPVNPDTNHLHQLIFKFINNKKNFIKIYSNQITSLLILLYNFFIFFISINFITKTNYMILLIILNIIIYLGTYTFLKESLKK